MNHKIFLIGLGVCLSLGLSACVPLAPPAPASETQAATAAQVEQFSLLSTVRMVSVATQNGHLVRRNIHGRCLGA